MNNKTAIEKFKELYGDKYDYSKIGNITSTSDKIAIVCPKHGEFVKTVNNHLHGQGCPQCKKECRVKNEKNEFLKMADELHKGKYDYSKVEYINNHTKVCIICPIHGEFWQTPEHFLRGQACKKCSNKLFKLNKEIFIERSNNIHNNKYDYSKVDYKTVEDKVCIVCPLHGEFWQTPHSHMSGVGCPKCHEENNINESRLFDIIKEKYGDEVIGQYKVEWLSGQTIDIYIPSKKIGIEYQGIQHFQPIKYFGGIKKYEYTVRKDKEKFEKCKNNGVKLFYFSKEKKIPNEYLDVIYSNNNDLLKEIEDYGT